MLPQKVQVQQVPVRLVGALSQMQTGPCAPGCFGGQSKTMVRGLAGSWLSCVAGGVVRSSMSCLGRACWVEGGVRTEGLRSPLLRAARAVQGVLAGVVDRAALRFGGDSQPPGGPRLGRTRRRRGLSCRSSRGALGRRLSRGRGPRRVSVSVVASGRWRSGHLGRAAWLRIRRGRVRRFVGHIGHGPCLSWRRAPAVQTSIRKVAA